MKLAIVITHPIRYVVPLLQLLVQRNKIETKAFFTFGAGLLERKKYHPDYRKIKEQDLPLFEGYDYEFVFNKAKKKSTSQFAGIDNPDIIQRIQQWQPDAILVFGWKFRSHLKVMRFFKGKIPVHFRGDSTLLDEHAYNFFKRTARHIFLRWVYKHIDKAWYVGSNNKAYYERLGLKPDQLVYVPHAVDNRRFSRTEVIQKEASLLRKKLGIPATALVFLYAGRYVAVKGIFTLVDAFKRMDMEDVHLLFTGGGKEAQLLKEKVAGSPRIHFLPYQTQTSMPLIYSAADVLVVPSALKETWGLVINEAMANGLAIIASNKCGATADLVDNGVNGYVFEAGDTNALLTCMQKMAVNRQQTSVMGANSVEKIRSSSFEIQAEAIEKMFLSPSY